MGEKMEYFTLAVLDEHFYPHGNLSFASCVQLKNLTSEIHARF